MKKTKNIIKSKSDLTLGVFSLALVIAFAFFLYLFGNVCITYDDCAIQIIVNGDLSGTPNGHLIFINYFFGFLIASLYTLISTVNWYTVFLLASLLFAIWSFLYRILVLTKQKPIYFRIIFLVVAIIAFYYLFFDSLINIYFSKCASVLAVVFLFYFVTAADFTIGETIITGMLGILSFCIRDVSFLEILPFVILVVIFKITKYSNKAKKIISAVIFVFVLIAMSLINIFAYKGEYSEEKQINGYRAQIQDYGGLPEYSENMDFYNELGMDKEDYDLLCVSWGLSDDFNVNNMKKILELKEKADADSTTEQNEQAEEPVTQFFQEDYGWEFWTILIISIVVALIVAIIGREYKMLLYFVIAYLIAFVELVFLFNNGRTPTYVTSPVLFAVLLINSGYSFINYSNTYRINRKKTVKIVALGMMLFTVILMICRIVDLHERNDELYTQKQQQFKLEQYFMDNQEFTFLCDNYCEPIDILNPRHRNYFKHTGWISETKDWEIAVKGEYETIMDALANRSDLRFCISQNTVAFLETYLNNHGYNVESQCETIILGDSQYNIWQINSLD